ncbi:MAG: hypothetical protein WCI73_08570 [Phycisphaerae bacterium]
MDAAARQIGFMQITGHGIPDAVVAALKVEIAKNLEVRVQRHAISAIMPKGTLKEL